MRNLLLVLITLAAAVFFYPAAFITATLTVIFWDIPEDKPSNAVYMTLPNGKKKRIE